MKNLKVVILKTSQKTIKEVVQHAKHGLHGRLNLRPGDLILISQTKKTLQVFEKPIRYIMEFQNYYQDEKNESLNIWHKYWPYIIEGRNCRILKKAFEMSDVQVTKKDYGRGSTIVYVDPDDLQVLIEKKLLD